MIFTESNNDIKSAFSRLKGSLTEDVSVLLHSLILQNLVNRFEVFTSKKFLLIESSVVN